MSLAARSIADMTIISILGETPRHDWTKDEARALISAPLSDLVHAAQTVHRRHFDANEVQVSTLLSIKTGGCPEDCAYCSQSSHHQSDVGADKLMSLASVRAAALRTTTERCSYARRGCADETRTRPTRLGSCFDETRARARGRWAAHRCSHRCGSPCGSLW